jgi:general secretion pathway protein G
VTVWYRVAKKGSKMGKKWQSGFTMLELTFVIVIIGILSAIAIPKLAATRDDAIITKARSTVASVRSAIATERQKRILRGVFDDLNASSIGTNFSKLLEYKVKTCNAAGCEGWSTNNLTFTFHGPTGDVVYKYQNKKLECTSGPCSDYDN